jgi:hypothetical protein
MSGMGYPIPQNQGNTTTTTTTQGGTVNITPLGPLTPDPTVRSDPRNFTRALPEQPSNNKSSSESAEMDYEDMNEKQKRKYNNKAAERE